MNVGTVIAIDDDYAYPGLPLEGTDPNDNSILVVSGSVEGFTDGILHTITTIDKDVLTNNATVSVDLTEAGGVITRTAGSWIADGFITIDEDFAQGEYEIIELTATSMTVVGGQLAPVSDAKRHINLIDPDTDVILKTVELDISVDPTYTGGIVTRSAGDWTQEGYLAGHLITMVDGNGKRDFRIVEISGDGKSLTLEGAPLADEAGVVKSFYVQGIHGGLNVIHGGGNFEIETTGDMNLAESTSGVLNADKDLIRLDGRAWVKDRYAVGQTIQLEGENYTRTILAFQDVPRTDPTTALSWGQGSKMVLGTPNARPGTLGVIEADNGDYLEEPSDNALSLHVAEPFKAEATGTMSIATTSADVATNNISTITRSAGSWLTDGFYQWQVVYVSGLAGGFTVSSLTATVMTLQNVALTPQTDVPLTVFGYDSTRDGGKRVGGDHIVVGHTETATINVDATNSWLTPNGRSSLGYDLLSRRTTNPDHRH